MLLIGDIHINTRHSKAILESLQSFTDKFSDEQHIVFAGDYMYMFSYDRQALGDLFDFFLQLREQGKNVYILTGNHDWLNQHFVYHEGKKVADILNKKTDNQIYFITEPEVHTIEGKEVLFMPYNKGFLGNYLNKCHPKDSEVSDRDFSLRSKGQSDGSAGHETIKLDTTPLLVSKNTNEQLSGALNRYLLEHYKPGMTLIHHYYTADISFPGQQAQFDYKDIALHPLRTTYASKIISGHLHKPFIHENYLCLGSIRSTTSGERNQSKFLRKRDTQNDTYEAYEIAINPYVSINHITGLTPDGVHKEIGTIQATNATVLSGVQIQNVAYDLPQTSLILYSPESVETIEQSIDSTLKATIGDIQLKQTNTGYKDMTELLDITQYNVKESLLDWKELVKKYLMSRYGPESEKYRTLLSELNIL